MRNKINIFALGLIVIMLFLVGCSAMHRPRQRLSETKGANEEQVKETLGSEIIDKIEKFAGDRGEEGQSAWKDLQSYPNLIASLLRLQGSLSEDNPLRVKIAFVLCNLNYNYQANREIIVSALNKIPRYQNFYADQAEAMISRLIDRGNKELLRVLFASVAWSDAALSEGLGETFARELQNKPESFLLELKNESIKIRQKIYSLISNSLPTKEITQVKKYLVSVPQNSPIAQVAEEMLKALSTK